MANSSGSPTAGEVGDGALPMQALPIRAFPGGRHGSFHNLDSGAPLGAAGDAAQATSSSSKLY